MLAVFEYPFWVIVAALPFPLWVIVAVSSVPTWLIFAKLRLPICLMLALLFIAPPIGRLFELMFAILSLPVMLTSPRLLVPSIEISTLLRLPFTQT
ncbi:MAG: hypothetical protein WCL30_01735 [Pseudomonadota bacterium]